MASPKDLLIPHNKPHILMADADFRQSEVLWSDHGNCISVDAPPYHRQKKSTTAGRKGLSSPVDIPKNNLLGPSWAPCFDNQGYGDDDHEGELSKEEGMIPPHVLVARGANEKIAFSVCTGNGRKLKGRDLQRVRNSVLKMTGFLES